MAVGFTKDGAEQLEVQAVIDAGIIYARAQIFKRRIRKELFRLW
ncbi:hypothetical protein BN80_033 [Yersinia phage phiR1-RT]|uniref:Uncharacterized protein n=1 Tax=Yersinia phage phiR1-RT TaxID=1206558 RepID=I7LEI3_BPPR1|nr:hypothetical protein BN80_033 [Yersinia phage phiR1-RT]CCI88607.1 hypothetical protein BN80_033 [Yersinia phage phiR1-RT]